MFTNHTKEELKLYGIYFIKNLKNNDIYIGSTIQSFGARKATHQTNYIKYLDNGLRFVHPILYRAYKKYGYENFEFIIYKAFKVKKTSKKC